MNKGLEYIKDIRIGKSMKKVLVKTLQKFDCPDEVRTFPHGKLKLIHLDGFVIRRTTFEPGWKRSGSESPFLTTGDCEITHFQLHISGTMKIIMNTGTQFEFRAGDISRIQLGKDAWVEGDEPVVIVDFQSMMEYLKNRKASEN